MRVAGLDKNGDWQLGKHKASYIVGSDMVAQNVVTRLKSFKRDWFLDADAEIDWVQLLGSRNNRQKILSEIERVVLNTFGVLSLESVDIVANRQNRDASITISYTDYSQVGQEINVAVEA